VRAPWLLYGSDTVTCLAAGFERGGPVDELANGVAHAALSFDHEDSWCPGDGMARELPAFSYLKQYEFPMFFV